MGKDLNIPFVVGGDDIDPVAAEMVRQIVSREHDAADLLAMLGLEVS